jgi:hypothetical protein
MSRILHAEWRGGWVALVLAAAVLADDEPGRPRVLVIHPGVWHVWFDAEPSPEIVARFAAIAPAGANSRVIRAVTMEPSVNRTGQYDEKPVWLLGFHWDQMIDTAVAHGIPVYVTTEKGIDMLAAIPSLRESRREPQLSADQVAWLRKHSFSGGTFGAEENHRRMMEVYAGVLQKFPDAAIASFAHSQSGRNLIGMLKVLFHTDRATFDVLVPHLVDNGLWDPAITPEFEAALSTPGLGVTLHWLYQATGHPVNQAERELGGKDTPNWIGQNGRRLRYGDFVREDDPEFHAALRAAGTKWNIGVAKGTVETRAAEKLAERVGGEFHDPKDMGRAAGQSGLSTSNVQNHIREPWVEAIWDHNCAQVNAIAMQQWFGITARGIPTYSDGSFRNSVWSDMSSAERPGGIDGRQAQPDHIDIIPVWNHATGKAEFIARRTLQVMDRSHRHAVVLDTSGNERLAHRIGNLIKSQGRRVFCAERLDDIADQTIAGHQLQAVVVRPAPMVAGAPTAKPTTTVMKGTPVRLADDPNSAISFPVAPQDVVPTVERLEAKERKRQEAAQQPGLMGVSVHIGSVPLAQVPQKEVGWTMTRVGDSQWFAVQHETWHKAELVYEGSDDSPERIVSAVRKQLRTQAAAEERSAGGKKSGKRRVVVGGNPDDPRAQQVIRDLQATDQDGDGESDVEVVFVNCQGLSPRQAIRKVATVKRETGADAGVAIIYMPGSEDSDGGDSNDLDDGDGDDSDGGDGDDSDSDDGDGDGDGDRDGPEGMLIQAPPYPPDDDDSNNNGPKPAPGPGKVKPKRLPPRFPPDGRAGVKMTDDANLEVIGARNADPRSVLQGLEPKARPK